VGGCFWSSILSGWRIVSKLKCICSFIRSCSVLCLKICIASFTSIFGWFVFFSIVSASCIGVLLCRGVVRCLAKCELYICGFFTAFMCSLYLISIFRLVFPMYILLQSLQVSLYIPLFLYIFPLLFCILFIMLLFVLNAILLFLNSLLIVYVCWSV
jgi:hypothetical protein